MKKLLFSVALVASAHAESKTHGSAKFSLSEFKKSYLFLDLGLGARVGRAKPYVEVRSGRARFTQEAPLNGYPGVAKTFSGFLASLGFGGDYTFLSSCFVLGGYVRYVFANTSKLFPKAHVKDLRGGQYNFDVTKGRPKLHARNYLSLGTRLGVRRERHLFVGMVGLTLASFAGSLWSVNQKGSPQKAFQYGSKVFPFLQLGGEYSYALTRHFTMGVNYTFNLGRVRLTRIRSLKFNGNALSSGFIFGDANPCSPRRGIISATDLTDPTDAVILSRLRSAETVYRSKTVSFSEMMAMFRYTMPMTDKR